MSGNLSPSVPDARAASPLGLALLLVPLLLSSCGAIDRSDSRTFDARERVIAELDRYYLDLSAHDWKAFPDHFWPGATISTIVSRPSPGPGESGTQVISYSVAEAIVAGRLVPDTPVLEKRMLDYEIRMSGPLAQVWARCQMRSGERGKVRESTSIDAFTLFERDGRWRIVSLAFVGDEVR